MKLARTTSIATGCLAATVLSAVGASAAHAKKASCSASPSRGSVPAMLEAAAAF